MDSSELAEKYYAVMHIEDEAERIFRIDLSEIVWPPREEQPGELDPHVALPVRLPEYVKLGHFRFCVRPGDEGVMVELECTIDREAHYEALVRVMEMALMQAKSMMKVSDED